MRHLTYLEARDAALGVRDQLADVCSHDPEVTVEAAVLARLGDRWEARIRLTVDLGAVRHDINASNDTGRSSDD